MRFGVCFTLEVKGVYSLEFSLEFIKEGGFCGIVVYLLRCCVRKDLFEGFVIEVVGSDPILLLGLDKFAKLHIY